MSRFRLIVRACVNAIRLVPIVFGAVIPALILMCVLSETKRFKSKTLFWFLDLSYRGMLWAVRVPVTYSYFAGVPKTPAVFIANHQSALDIPLVGAVLHGTPHVWVALAYYLRFPILGTFIRRIGIPVRPISATSGMQTLRTAVAQLKEKDRSLIIFPEGGRYVDGDVHDFRGGFGILARTAGLPVVPIFIEHAGAALPPKSILVRPIPCRVVVGVPHEYRVDETDEQFMARIYAWYRTHAQ